MHTLINKLFQLLKYFPHFYTRSNIVRGALVYCIGDTIAALITNDLSLHRSLGMALIGATFYAFEIPNYLLWLHGREFKIRFIPAKLIKPFLFQLYFNPFWVARHILFINLISFTPENISWNLISVGFISFIFQLPVSLPCNYIIVEVIPYRWRFFASAILSALMAVYFAMSETWFG